MEGIAKNATGSTVVRHAPEKSNVPDGSLVTTHIIIIALLMAIGLTSKNVNVSFPLLTLCLVCNRNAHHTCRGCPANNLGTCNWY